MNFELNFIFQLKFFDFIGFLSNFKFNFLNFHFLQFYNVMFIMCFIIIVIKFIFMSLHYLTHLLVYNFQIPCLE